MISREFNLNLDIININKYIKKVQVYQNDVYQCILNIKVFKDTKELNLAEKYKICVERNNLRWKIKYLNY